MHTEQDEILLERRCQTAIASTACALTLFTGNTESLLFSSSFEFVFVIRWKSSWIPKLKISPSWPGCRSSCSSNKPTELWSSIARSRKTSSWADAKPLGGRERMASYDCWTQKLSVLSFFLLSSILHLVPCLSQFYNHKPSKNIQLFCKSLIFCFQLLVTKLYGGIEPQPK